MNALGAQKTLLETAAGAAAVAALAETFKKRGMSETEAYNTARQLVLQEGVAAVPPPTFFEQYKWFFILGGLAAIGVMFWMSRKQSPPGAE